MSAGTLSREALDVIRSAGLTRREYVVDRFGGTQWYGDRCGCTDDRCIGHHHAAGEACGCFPVLLQELLDARAVADGSKVVLEHDCDRWGDGHKVTHAAAVRVVRRVELGCGCTRVEATRCDGRGVHAFEQVCSREHE